MNNLADNSPYRMVATQEQLDALLDEMEQADLIAVDTETEGLEFDDIIVGVCISTKVGTGYYIPVRHEMYEGVLYEGQLSPDVVFPALKPLLESKPLVGHNVKFDLQAFLKEGIFANFVHDTLAISVLFCNYMRNGLKFLVKELLGHDMADLASLFTTSGNKKAVIAPKILSPEEIFHYAVEDANWTLQLFEVFLKMPNMAKNLKGPLYTIEMSLLPYVAEMEAFGLPVSKKFLEHNAKLANEYEKKIYDSIVEAIREELGDPDYKIKLTSVPQLRQLLFTDLKLPVIERTAKGEPSTNSATMKVLAEQNHICKRIQEYRTLKKLNSTYLTGLIPKVHDDLRIRGTFNQLGTATGRFSSSKPNLQNLPQNQVFYLWPSNNEDVIEEYTEKGVLRETSPGFYERYDLQKEKWTTDGYMETDYKGRPVAASDGKLYGLEFGRMFDLWECRTRNFVRAAEGHYIVEADYSQVELRILAGETQEPTLMDAYLSGEDVHRATAAAIFSVDPESVTNVQRQAGKTINFSLLYGAGKQTISKSLGISEDEAQELIDKYFLNLPEVGYWIDDNKIQATRAGKSVTNIGRVRHFDKIKQNNKFGFAQKREAVNFKIQGAAADVMKLALARTGKRLRERFGDNAKMVCTVHDSVLLEVHNDIPMEEIVAVLRDSMADPKMLALFNDKWPPLRVDFKKGEAWADADELDFDDDLPMPPLYEGDLPKVRTRQIAKERSMGISVKSDEGDILNLIGSDTSRLERPEVSWVLEIPQVLNTTQLNALMDFISEKQHEDSTDTLRVEMMNEDGTVENVEIKKRVSLTMDDQINLRIKVGNCVLRQDNDGFDPDEVLKGVDFDL